ncbi:MAG: hypothetical protein EWM50_06775 [Gottschalkiaceae bacterium]|nr:MAG: hypothetical protein EWM50_06775 [Gottschalkiaceae bacterium]
MEFLFNGETKNIEYKKEYSKSILKTISAMANYQDGYIVIGIDDDSNVTGVDNPKAIKLMLENSINDNILPIPYYEIFEKKVDDKIIVVLQVFVGENTPYLYNNKAYKRMNTSTVTTDKIEYENLILKGRNIGYDGLSYNDNGLSFEYLNKKIRQQLGIGHLSKDILKTLGLMKNEEYTIAAALLSDENPIHSSGISLIRFDSDTTLNIIDKNILRNISLIEGFDKSIEFYEKHINKKEVIKGAYRETIEEVPLVAFRESIANAIVHREYMVDADIRVEIFDDRIEIISPGGLPIGITEEEYLDGRVSVPRNRIIADIFLRLGIIERLATGIRRIKGYYKDKNVNPEFLIAQNSIKVILPKISSQKNTTVKLNDTNVNANDMNENELKIVKHLNSTGRISRKEAEEILSLKKTQAVQVLGGLIDKGIIIRVGSGRNTAYEKPRGVN